MNTDFNFTIPATIEKSEAGDWKIRGLASTESRDQQGETILQRGMDLTPIDKKQGFLNFDHKPHPENLIGVVEGYNRTPKGLFIEGRLFKNHTRAKAIYEIMSSLKDSDRGKIGLSVEGSILERDARDPKIIKKCRIKNVAVTFNPVNTDTYADLVKSMSSDVGIDFQKSEIEFENAEIKEGIESIEIPAFTASQVLSIVQKALGVGAGAAEAPSTRMGGNALTVEDLDRKKKKQTFGKNLEVPQAQSGTESIKLPNDKTGDVGEADHTKKVDGHELDNGNTKNGMAKALKRMSFGLYKSHMFSILNRLQELYPEYSRSEIWEAVRERMMTKFPELK